MNKEHPYRTTALAFAKETGVLTAREAARRGIHSEVLSRMVARGELERVARGHYRLPDVPVTEHHSLSIVGAAAPRAVLCLLSALEFHGLGTAVPSRVWIAIDRRSRAPKLEWPPLRVFRFGGSSLTEGVEEHEVEGVTLRVFSPAKTVADLFKFRSKVGLDVALEALRAVWAEERARIDELVHYGRVCRVDRVMRPYLEAVVS